MSTLTNQAAEREKRLVALSSVLAAIFLTSMKVVIGLLTNSLGILSEAAHSGLDLIAAGVTFFAVRVSDRPPDYEHPYGHGKVENLSALVETLLLLATCGWIIYEAIHRLVEPVHVESSIWSFIVMGTSIVIDVTRSRALMRAAKKHNSQALEADALHFSTDVWSSSVVIAGLVAVSLGQWLHDHSHVQADWLFRADAVAALGVSAIVVWVSLQLGRRTVSMLLDSAPQGVAAQIEQEVAQVPGVAAVQRIRLRQSGPATFVDMTLSVPRSASFEEAHDIAARAEAAVQQILPRTDVMVHIDPVVKDDKSLVEQVRSVAARQGVGVHGLRIHDVRGHLSLDMHVEVPDHLTVSEAHERATAFETALRSGSRELSDVVTHIEPVGDREARRSVTRLVPGQVQRVVLSLPRDVPGVQDCHHISVYRDGNDLSALFHVTLAPNLSISDAHKLTVQLESVLRAQLPELGRVVIHVEPPNVSDQLQAPCRGDDR
jgi:cation diffusion facilitator family transporter